ncbi:MAG TPA: OmpA family protein [Steroidobacteraceae bacterium]|nr:OmpA family protein [Steroidobacteraceae bacterium]
MTTLNLKHATIALAVAAGVAGTPAWADPAGAGPESNARAEDIGIVTGLAVGAAAGGPVGALLGAAAGGLMGDRYHHQREQAQAQGERLEHTLAAVDAVGMDVSFRTGDASISVADMAPLLKLGALAAAVPDARLRIAGFADPRGSAAYNEALSQRRAEAVAAALVCGGIARERLIIEAHGARESLSADGDLDAYALDRRVIVRLERVAAATPASAAVARTGPVVVGP